MAWPRKSEEYHLWPKNKKCPPCQELAVKKKNLTEVEEMVH